MKGVFVGGPYDGDKIGTRDDWPDYFLGPVPGGFMRSYTGNQTPSPETLATATFRYDRTNRLDSQGRLIYQYQEIQWHQHHSKSETNTFGSDASQPQSQSHSLSSPSSALSL